MGNIGLESANNFTKLQSSHKFSYRVQTATGKIDWVELKTEIFQLVLMD